MKRRMHLPGLLLALAAIVPGGARADGGCDEQCLLGLADKALAAIAAKDYRGLPWADPVRFSENEVSLMIGDGWWGSAGATIGKKALAIADVATGNVVWFGKVWDHDDPALAAVRIKAPDGRIEELEVLAARTPGPLPIEEKGDFAFPAKFARDLKAAEQSSRARLIDLADGYLSTRQGNDGALLAAFTPDCALHENGLDALSLLVEEHPGAADCASQFGQGLFAPVERVRDRRFPVVDVERGLVVAISVQDIPVREELVRTTDGKAVKRKHPFPMSRTVAEVIRIEGGRIAGSEGVAVYLPYRMPTPWK